MSGRERESALSREQYRLERARECKRHRKYWRVRPELYENLNIYQTLLNVQSMLLEQLAAEENSVKGYSNESRVVDVNLDDRIKEVESLIRSLHY